MAWGFQSAEDEQIPPRERISSEEPPVWMTETQGAVPQAAGATALHSQALTLTSAAFFLLPIVALRPASKIGNSVC